MARISVLILFYILILASCEPISGDLTPTVALTPDNATATPIAPSTQTPGFASPTPETIDDAKGLSFFRVMRTVNVRLEAGIAFPVLYQLQVGTVVIAYDPLLRVDGIWWVWVVNNCTETLPATGFVARTDGGITWLLEDETITLENC
jgi:hypothetical protein